MENVMKRVAIAIGKVIGACMLWKIVTIVCRHYHK